MLTSCDTQIKNVDTELKATSNATNTNSLDNNQSDTYNKLEEIDDGDYVPYPDSTMVSMRGRELKQNAYNKLINRIHEDISLVLTNDYSSYSEYLDIADSDIKSFYENTTARYREKDYEYDETEWERDSSNSFEILSSALNDNNTTIKLNNEECFKIVGKDYYFKNQFQFVLEGDSVSLVDVEAYYIYGKWYIYYQGFDTESKEEFELGIANEKAMFLFNAVSEKLSDWNTVGKYSNENKKEILEKIAAEYTLDKTDTNEYSDEIKKEIFKKYDDDEFAFVTDENSKVAIVIRDNDGDYSFAIQYRLSKGGVIGQYPNPISIDNYDKVIWGQYYN